MPINTPISSAAGSNNALAWPAHWRQIPVLLMDEPFGALDPVTRGRIRQEFKELDEFKNKTVVMVTHDIRDALELGDRIGIMDKGQLIQTGTPEELQQNPANDFVAAFLHGQNEAS